MSKKKWASESLRLFFLVLMLISSQFLPGCSRDKPESLGANPAADELSKHGSEFVREVVHVTDGVYSFIGFGLANCIVIEGRDGYVLVDTMESDEAALRVKKEIDRIMKGKPLKAIIYTHHHSDHTFGTRVFTGKKNIDIYAYESTAQLLDRVNGITREASYRRAMRQFGAMLPEKDFINCGIGPFLDFNEKSTVGLLRPTRTFTGRKTELVLAGTRMILVHAPGETEDQIFIWLPDKKTLLAADNFYHSFPNLYAIRGTPYRDVMKWVNSIDEMRDLKAQYLVPSHTRPVTGRDRIYRVLTDYRDAIQYVHDQTIRMINKGMTGQEIVEALRLPAHLADRPYLREYYGTVAWSARAVFNGYLGWFSGNAMDLFPLPLRERAMRMAELAGGSGALLLKARKAVKKGDYQWSLELADHVLVLDPDDGAAREVRALCLRRLGERQVTATARNYYLTSALEAEGKLVIQDRKVRERDVARSLPLEVVFRAMAVNLDPEKSSEVNKTLLFHFPDTGEEWTVAVRRGVAEVRPGSGIKPDLVLTINSIIWKEIVAGFRNPALAYAAGDINVTGGAFDLVKFLRLFSKGR